MARCEMALLFLLSAPCARASHLTGAHLIGLSPTRAEVKRSDAVPGIPDVSGDVSAAEDVLVKVNTSWADMQDLFGVANQTAAHFLDSATADVNDVVAKLPKVQAAVDAIGRLPFAPHDTEAIQDLVDAFIGQVNASTQVFQDKIAAAERPVHNAIQPALDRMHEVVEAVTFKFRRALEKVADLASTLEKAVSDAQEAMSPPQAKEKAAEKAAADGQEAMPHPQAKEKGAADAREAMPQPQAKEKAAADAQEAMPHPQAKEKAGPDAQEAMPHPQAKEKAGPDAQEAMPHTQAEAASSFIETAAETDSVDERFWPFGRFGAKESVWSTATSAIAEANETLLLFAEKVDGINASLMEIVLVPIQKAAQDAMDDFMADCDSAVYQLPDLVSAEASSVCSVAANFDGASKEAFGKLERATADVVDKVKGNLDSVFGMVESLSLLVAKTQHIVGILEDRAAAAPERAANASRQVAPLPNKSQENNATQPEQPGKAQVKP